jgi:arylsulfatase A-like enzyme
MKNNAIINILFIWLIFCVEFSMAQTASKKKNNPPNIIVILADDLGYQDVGFNGCKDIPTPNIDRIANNGVTCTNGYVVFPVCSPSRAGLMTGRYPQRFGHERNPQYRPHNPTMGLPKSETTIAQTLKTVGYHSGIIGKWHLGADTSNHPISRGFDEFFGHLGGGHVYFPELLVHEDSYGVEGEDKSYRTWIMRNHESVETKKYLTDEFSDEAVSFIQRNKNQPFFLYLSYNAPHAPLQASQKYLDRFPTITNERRKTYAAMVSALDYGVGQVLNTLASLQLEENTLVFFLSDNGGPENDNASNNGKLREGKSSVYEGGFRVPFALQWKGRIPKAIYENPVSSLDIYATITELSKAKIDKNKPLDGVNLVPFLTGKNKKMPHEVIYVRKYDQDQFVVRDHDLKLVIHGKTGKKKLFDLKNDISETQNIADIFPKEVERLEKIRVKWNSELVAPAFLGLEAERKK